MESNDTPEGRKTNRRVDIVLDRRNTRWISLLEKYGRDRSEDGSVFIYKDFRFDIRKPGQANATGGE
ncbi:MAG: hypothetical protein ACOCWR_09130, partial [Oceanidesulfovibrio sp.]